jgi:hypothetical protein
MSNKPPSNFLERMKQQMPTSTQWQDTVSQAEIERRERAAHRNDVAEGEEKKGDPPAGKKTEPSTQR